MDNDTGMLGSVVVNFANLDFTAFKRLDYRINYSPGSLTIWYLRNRKCLVINLLYLGTDLYSPTLSPSLYRLTSIIPRSRNQDTARTLHLSDKILRHL